MAIRLDIKILGEILQVRNDSLSTAWSPLYPGRVFRTQDVSFTYDELRGMGNGKHLVNAKSPPGNVAGGSKGGERPPTSCTPSIPSWHSSNRALTSAVTGRFPLPNPHTTTKRSCSPASFLLPLTHSRHLPTMCHHFGTAGWLHSIPASIFKSHFATEGISCVVCSMFLSHRLFSP